MHLIVTLYYHLVKVLVQILLGMIYINLKIGIYLTQSLDVEENQIYDIKKQNAYPVQLPKLVITYSGVPNRSAGTYAEFRLRRWRHGKFFDLLFKT